MSLAGSLLGDGLKLPISRRGLFSKDDFFSGFQQEYSRAVGDVLDRWRSRSSAADRFASYKRLRERDASDDSQAATISETPDNYVIVLDMAEYSGGQITVETQGFSAVVKGEEGERTYHRRFPLPPDTNIDRVVADLSHESILTVSAPRKGKGEGAISTAPPSSREANFSNKSFEEQTIPTKVRPTEKIIPTVRQDAAGASENFKVQQEVVSTAVRKGSSGRIIPLTIEGDTTTATTCQTSVTSQDSSTSSSERVIPTAVESDGAAGQRKTSTQSSSSSSVTTHSRVLPIQRRGRFFQDSTFEKVWGDFDNAVDDLVARKGSRAGLEDDQIQTYRNLRKVIKEDDNQAATVSKENEDYKIVIDVKDFVDGLLDVKALDGSVLVTGQNGKCNFERRFSLPEMAQPEKVAAALSADGVLTITAPK